MTAQSPRGNRGHYGTLTFMFLVGLIIGLLTDEFRTPAYAQIPDPAKQRTQTATEVKKTNELLAEILGTLQNQTLKVRIVETDKSQGERVRKPTLER